MSATRMLSGRSKTTATAARLRGKAGVLGTVMAVLVELQERARQHRHLQDLDDRLLRDVGLSRRDIERETGKLFRSL